MHSEFRLAARLSICIMEKLSFMDHDNPNAKLEMKAG